MVTPRIPLIDDWIIFQNVFRFFRHEDFRDDLEASLDGKSLSNVSICKRKNKLNYWTILQNVFRFFLAKGQGTFTFVISRNFADGDFPNSTAGQIFIIFSAF